MNKDLESNIFLKSACLSLSGTLHWKAEHGALLPTNTLLPSNHFQPAERKVYFCPQQVAHGHVINSPNANKSGISLIAVPSNSSTDELCELWLMKGNTIQWFIVFS